MYTCMYAYMYVCMSINFKLRAKTKAVMARAGDKSFRHPSNRCERGFHRGEDSYCVLLGYPVCSVVGDWQRFRQTLLPSTEDNSTHDSSQISGYDSSVSTRQYVVTTHSYYKERFVQQRPRVVYNKVADSSPQPNGHPITPHPPTTLHIS